MPVSAYDDCWLRYHQLPEGDRRDAVARRCSHAYVSAERPELGVVREELREGLSGLLGREPHLWQHPPRSKEGFLAIGRRGRMEIVRDAVDQSELDALHDEGYVIRSTTWEGQECLVVTAATDAGLVYGTFALLRRLSLGADPATLDEISEPTYEHRMIDHWDNPFRRSVERGYAGMSIFDWERLPDLRERYDDYARLLASVGINGIVVNNVNTQKPDREGQNDAVDAREGWQLLESENVEKVAALADRFRRYGIETFLSVNYAAPIFVAGLDTADPLNDDVEAFWRDKVDELYDRIPDFGGFLVKADSEGQPGPYDYDRSHAEGANVLGRAFEGHPGRVFWRAFVYSDHDDRAVQAYETFAPLDGEFHEKVTVQVKNGPIDYQPREPVSTLFGAMDETNLACELQITQEYTGQGVHCTYHVPLWKEVLEFDTHADGPDTPVKDRLTGPGQGLAGVANVGEDPSWTGHYLAQANLYGYGRLLWDPDLATETITREWARQSFEAGGASAAIDAATSETAADATDAAAEATEGAADATDATTPSATDGGPDATTDDDGASATGDAVGAGTATPVVDTIAGILHDSWPANVDYTTGGLGLIHMMYNGEDVVENHYDPSPREWPGYVGADVEGIGVDRSAYGSGYAQQYADPVADRYEDPETCPEELLLFFHHLPWEYALADGTTVIQRLYDNCYAGAARVEDLRDRWATLEGSIDERRHRHVAERLDEQVCQARRWRDVLTEYFHAESGIADAEGRVPEAD